MTVPLPPPQSGNEQAPVALLDGPLREASALVCSCSHSRSLESWPAWRGLMSAWFRENWQACGARRTGHAKDVKGLALVGIIYAVLSLPHLSEAACAKRRRARPRALEVALARVLRRPLRHHIQQASDGGALAACPPWPPANVWGGGGDTPPGWLRSSRAGTSPPRTSRGPCTPEGGPPSSARSTTARLP
eukprot:CAMPEP_0114285440 /NCGR_PEP_ID=MMETSP0059-20121206/5183_1 /TAXON_ID=36894 /ORGANISM="Pyramimonas parkeae, Strain CCMP726" /LENGTH=189 /DNA_ID=CAMNT_0001406329 /DNA_START=397 /DNA_END=966 /DNA_ORIENTATION=+